MDVQPASAERAPALDKAFFRKAAWRYPAVIFKNGDTLRSCFSVQALCFCSVFLDHGNIDRFMQRAQQQASANHRRKKYMHASTGTVDSSRTAAVVRVQL